MSLELALSALTTAVLDQTTVMQSFIAAQAQFATSEAPAAEKVKGTRTKKTEQAAADTANPRAVLLGDPEGTVYYDIAAHNSVYRQLPGQPAVNIASAVQVSALEFEAAKETYAKKALTLAASGTPTDAPATTPTPPTSSPEPVLSAASGEVTFKQVVEGLTALNGGKAPGQGREAVKALLAKWLPNGGNVPALEALKKNAEILAEVNSLLTPAAATDDNLFG